MAARITLAQNEHVRAKIQTSQLVNRLNSIAMGEIEATQAQLKAIEIALRKTLPDLSAITISGDDENPVKLEIAWAKPSSE